LFGVSCHYYFKKPLLFLFFGMLPYNNNNNNNNVHQQLSLGRVRGGNASIFPTTATTTSRLSSSTANGLPLNLLVDAAISKVPVSVTGSNKRSYADSSVGYSSPPMKRSTFLLQHHQQKKPRVTSTPAKSDVSSLATSNPILMERLCSLSGGFPMPKFSAFKKKGKAAIAEEALKVCQELQQDAAVTRKTGSFPMPSLTERNLKSFAPKSLEAFEKIWTQIDDPHLRKEMFARKLQKGGL
jgi:hypothetical protein